MVGQFKALGAQGNTVHRNKRIKTIKNIVKGKAGFGP